MNNKGIQSVGEEEILKVLKKRLGGLTITDLVGSSSLSRSTIRVALAKLEGSGDISYRNVGMAKVYVIGGVGRSAYPKLLGSSAYPKLLGSSAYPKLLGSSAYPKLRSKGASKGESKGASVGVK